MRAHEQPWDNPDFPLLSPYHRFVVLRLGKPVFTCERPLTVVAYLWGRPIVPGHLVVLDYEKPVPVLCANLGHLSTLLGLTAASVCAACNEMVMVESNGDTPWAGLPPPRL